MTRQFMVALACVLVWSLGIADGAAQAPGPRVIHVAAQRFEFWPSEIRMREGELVEFRVQSDDTLHGFRIVGTNVNILVPKRGKGEAVVAFTAPGAGRYTIECNRLCGAGHNFMRASLIVQPAAASAVSRPSEPRP